MRTTMDLSMVPYDHMGSDRTDCESGDGDAPVGNHRRRCVGEHNKFGKVVKYLDCMRNHAASIGGHANDGCGEFMPGGEEGSREALRCAACGCHRNFHRKDVPEGCADHHLLIHHHHHHPLPSPPPMAAAALYKKAVATTITNSPRSEKKMGGFTSLPPALSLHQTQHRGSTGVFGGVDLRYLQQQQQQHEKDKQDRGSETPERGEVQVGTVRNKRFRTKFTQEQKDKMLEFAEKLGWRIQKHDDVELNQFCLELGIKRRVLKVWMHNNKNAFRKRENVPESSPLPTDDV